jgi:catechol 2,3-dioxygenase-like lactoylglutathione lyase family enzyme
VNLEHNRWRCLPVTGAAADATLTADVTGRTCALDVIVPDAQLPPVGAGDLLAFLDTGAYQDSAATNFNALPRPGTALVTGDRAELVRRHETLDDVFGRDLIPERLRVKPDRADGAAGGMVIGIDHVSVTCADLDRSLAFYGDLLGVAVRGRGEEDGSSEFEITGISDPRVRWADLQLPHGQVLELIEYERPRGTPVRPEPNDPGATHISLRVPDADAVCERLRAAGVSVRSDPVTIDAAGAWQGARAFYAADPDGVTVELIQLPAGRGG